MAGTTAFAPRRNPSNGVTFKETTLHLLTADGHVWRENDPNTTTPQPYWDYAGIHPNYIQTLWVSPIIHPTTGDQGRFRLWDVLALIQSQDPHGLSMSIEIDYRTLFSTSKVWTWDTANTQTIAPGGVIRTPGLTQLRNYDGRLGEAFQVAIADLVDPASVTGQGVSLLGLTGSLGVQPGPYKVPGGNTQ